MPYRVALALISASLITPVVLGPLVATAPAAGPSPRACGYFKARFLGSHGGSMGRMTVRGVSCARARVLANSCAARLYPPTGWHARGIKNGALGWLTAGRRSIALRAVTLDPPLCTNPDVPRRPSGISRYAGRLGPSALGPLAVGMGFEQAEVASGLEFGELVSFCTKSYAIRGVVLELPSPPDPWHQNSDAILITRRGIPTERGVQVGDDIDRVIARYGERAHLVNDVVRGRQGPEIVYEPSDPPERDYRIVFWTDGRKVTLMAAGRARDVERRQKFCVASH
jgi:hypothetical protein